MSPPPWPPSSRKGGEKELGGHPQAPGREGNPPCTLWHTEPCHSYQWSSDTEAVTLAWPNDLKDKLISRLEVRMSIEPRLQACLNPWRPPLGLVVNLGSYLNTHPG